MTASAVPAAIDALVAAFTAALPTVPVYDGPGVSDDASQSYVFVGVDDPDTDGYAVAASASQSWAWLGHNQRDEEFTVNCVAVAWNGDADQKAARDAVYATLTALTAAMQTDPSLSGALLFVKGISSSDLHQLQDANGAKAVLPFAVACRARLS